MNPKDAPNNLAIIGASGTGKTTLAVGLYATSTKTFTVSPIGDETRRYLEIRKTSIEEGFWPAATNESENFDLRIRLHAVGRQTDIVFRDYMGERMEKDPNYLKEVIGKPKSAMILFNPGMPGGTCKKAAEAFRSISKPLENAKGAAEGGFDPRIVAEQIKNIKSSLNRLVFLNDKKGESSRDELVSECDSTSSELEAWGRSAESVSDSEFERMANRLQSMASRIDVLKPIGLAEPEPRNRMIGNLKKIAQHLKDNGCIAVAFVVTATDRLASDLAGFREDFESYAAEITNHLTNLGLKWKRFEVTVSGPLDDQNKPKLARGENNTTHEPFLWLLDCIKRDASRKRVKAAAATAAAALAIAGATFGGLLWQSRTALDKAEKELAACLAALDKAYAVSDESAVRTNAAFLTTNGFERIRVYLSSDKVRKDALSGRAAEQNDLWGVRQLAMEFSARSNSLASTPLNVPLDWFAAFDKKLISSSPSFADAVGERDELANAWASTRRSLETHCQTAHFRDNAERESKNLAAAKPDAIVEPLKKALDLMTDKDRKYALVTNRTELSAGLRVERTNAVARYIDSQTDWKPTDDNPPPDAKDIVQRIRRDLKSALTSDEFAGLETAIGQRRAEARLGWEKHQFPLRRRAQLDELKPTSDSPATALKGSLTFLNGMDGLFPSIPEAERISARTAITNERAAAIARYIDAKADWKPEDDDPPGKIDELHRQVRTELKGALTDAEFASLSTALKERCTNARKSWDAWHFPRRSDELETALKNAGANPALPLKESLAFLGSMTNDYPTISQAEFIRTRRSIEQARKDALAAYADSIDKWNPKSRMPPELDWDKIHQTVHIDETVTDGENNVFERDIRVRFDKAKSTWNTEQMSLVEKFKVDRDIQTVVREYGEFIDENNRNPYLNNLHDRMRNRLREYYVDYINEYLNEFIGEQRVSRATYPAYRMKAAQDKFNEFRAVCLQVDSQSWSNSPIQKETLGKFVHDCVSRGKLQSEGLYSCFPQQFIITSIEAKFEPTVIGESYTGLSMGCWFKAFQWDFSSSSERQITDEPIVRNAFISRYNQGWVTVWSGNYTSRSNPWTFAKLYVEYADNSDAITKGSVSAYGRCLLDYFANEDKAEYSFHVQLEHMAIFLNENTEGTLSIRITYRCEGPDLLSMWKARNP